MSDPQETPAEYVVSCSGRVREQLIVLSRVCRERGDGDEFLSALREFERRLRVYPQFGDPLADLGHDGETVRIGIVRPLSMRYALIESRQLVLLAALPVLMPIRGS